MPWAIQIDGQTRFRASAKYKQEEAAQVNLSTTGLDRFVEAQDKIFATVLAELSQGCKESHWMWFVFPQLKELGRSPMAKYYGIDSPVEALAYWRHPILGNRLLQCTKLLLTQGNSNAHEIFGTPDDLKFRSCMTLFNLVATNEPAFSQALMRFFGGKPDEATVELLRKSYSIDAHPQI